MDSLLTVDSLQVQFNTKKGINTAVDGISFSVGKGEILGIVGESRSGKSTLMKSLYFDFDITEGQGYLRDFENGEADIFGQSLQKK